MRSSPTTLYDSTHELTLDLLDAVELGFIGLGVITLPMIILAYSRINAKRDKISQELTEKGVEFSEEQLRQLGDRAPDFRYTL